MADRDERERHAVDDEHAPEAVFDDGEADSDEEWDADEEETWDGEADEDEERDEDEEEAWDETEPLPLLEAPPGFRSGFVAVVGRPNVGKSTLVNAYVGQKVAIVSPKPQTTRRRIRGVRTSETAQIVFVDTPGIHRPLHPLGQFMVDEAVESIPDADVILWVVDVSQRPGEDDQQVAGLLGERAEAPIVIALNKADAVKPAYLQANFDAYLALVEHADWMLVSAARGDNLDKLLEKVTALLPEGPLYFPPDDVTDHDDRFQVAELIREAALYLTEREVPHSLAVAIEDWEERESGVVYIGATVYVERDTQKGIVIGKRGSMLKAIGSRARAEIEALLDRKVYLELHVRVRDRWRRNPDQLRRLGFVRDEGDEA